MFSILSPADFNLLRFNCVLVVVNECCSDCLYNIMTLTFLGIYYAFAIVGPAIGYLAGGAFLNIYVDVDKLDTARYGSPYSHLNLT